MAPSAISVDQTPEPTALKSAKELNGGHVTTQLLPQEDELLNKSAPALDPAYQIVEKPIGTRRPIRVACMGAGYSGLMMAITFSQKMQGKNAELVVYERNEDLGGTWLENRYIFSRIIGTRKRLTSSDILAASAISPPTTTPIALLRSRTGQITTRPRNRFTNTCMVYQINTTAIGSSSTSTPSSQPFGTSLRASGR